MDRPMGAGSGLPDTAAVTAIETEAAARLRAALAERTRVRAEFLLGYVDLAIRGTLEYDRFDRVYLGPWWDLPTGSPELRGWKRAVLRRVPAAGAEHWGHLFLVIHDADDPAALDWAQELRRGKVEPAEPTGLVLRALAPEIRLYFRPTSAGTEEPLASFVREVGERFRRQMD